jgi:hypothetical protein
MNTKRKLGVILILVGIGIPLALYFFQVSGEITFKEDKIIERVLTENEKQKIVKAEEKYKADKDMKAFYDQLSENVFRIPHGGLAFPYKYSIGIGIIIELLGIGFFTFSFFPSKKA